MALSRDQVGLLFNIQADSKDAKADLEAFKEFVAGLIEGIEKEFAEQSKKIEDFYKKQAIDAEKSGQTVVKSNVIIQDSFRALSRDALQSLGLSGEALTTFSSQVTKLSSSFATSAAGVAAGAGLIVAGMVAAAHATAELGDEIDDLSQSTGLSAETLSALNVAARQEEKSLSSLESALSHFNVTVSSAQSGNKQLSSLFKQLGVDARATADQAFRQVIDALAKMPEGANKTAVAVKLFGRAGADLIPILNDMEGGIDGAIEKAKELGLFFDKEGVKTASAYKNELIALNLQFEGLKNSVGQAAIPALLNLTTLIRDLIKDTRALFNLKFQGSTFEAFLKDLPNLLAGKPAVNIASKVAEDAAKSLPPPEEEHKDKKVDLSKPGKTPRDQAAEDALRLLKIQEEAAQREAQTEIKAARDSFEEREITIDQLVNITIAAELKMLAAKQATFDKEKEIIEESKLREGEKAIKLAELAERQAQAEQKANDEITKILKERQRIARAIAEDIAKTNAQITEASLKAQIDAAKFNLEQNRNAVNPADRVTEEQTARQIAAIEQEIFDVRQRKLEQDKELAKSDQEALHVGNELIKLDNERALAAEKAQRDIQAAREKDLQDLIQKSQQIKQIYLEIDNARKRAEQANPFSSRSFFGDEFADALRRTGSELAAFQSLAQGVAKEVALSMKSLKEIGVDAIDDFANGVGSLVQQYVLLGTTGPAALRKLLAATLASIAAEAAVNAIKALAIGFLDLATGDFPGAAAAFESAALWGAVAGTAGIVGRAIAPSSASSSNGAGKQSSDDNGHPIIEQGGALPRSVVPVEVHIHAQVDEGVSLRAVEKDYRNNGVTRTLIRRDLLGEQ